jgi:NOL1/NOP2/sun family putative RNA methylase
MENQDKSKGRYAQETIGVLGYKYNPKPLFEERMNTILELSGSNDNDKKAFWKIVHTEPINSIRCNTIKINPKELKIRLEKRGWKISQPYSNYPEIMIIENPLKPGEIGRSEEHLLGYYYVQEISSMMPILSLKPTKEDNLLDLCASPGSKTTQAAAMMENSGNIIANDNNMGRMIVLASNLEKCGVSNTVVTKRDGVQMCKQLKKAGFSFDKVLCDVPCSGEGTLRSSPSTFITWNIKTVENLASQQKVLAAAALEVLKVDGEMIYSTCTHAPEENEEVIQFLMKNFDIKIETIELPIKTRDGITKWRNQVFNKEIKKARRIYPQDNNTEGFFLCKIKKLSEKGFKEEQKEINWEDEL